MYDRLPDDLTNVRILLAQMKYNEEDNVKHARKGQFGCQMKRRAIEQYQ